MKKSNLIKLVLIVTMLLPLTSCGGSNYGLTYKNTFSTDFKPSSDSTMTRHELYIEGEIVETVGEFKVYDMSVGFECYWTDVDGIGHKYLTMDVVHIKQYTKRRK